MDDPVTAPPARDPDRGLGSCIDVMRDGVDGGTTDQ
jgi:hypothetical protein